jgi:hypothetical protein
MSHEEYVAGCDEDQIEGLIEAANKRLAKIRSSGWVKLWTVSIGYGNVAWFREPDYEAAVDYACKAVKAESTRRGAQDLEMSVELERYRPGDVDDLLATTKPLKG